MGSPSEGVDGVSQGVNALWWNLTYRRRMQAQVHLLRPWYHPMLLPGLILTRPITQETVGQWWNAERGRRKWDQFILPLIRDHILGATVLELGTNSSLNLVLALQHGARLAMGVEPDRRYYAQALLVRQCFGLMRSLSISRCLSDFEQMIPAAYGQVDLGLMCAVLRHIPEAERVTTLERMGRLCRRIFIQGSGLADAPDGDSVESVMCSVREAGLRVEEMRCIRHVRGFSVRVTSNTR